MSKSYKINLSFIGNSQEDLKVISVYSQDSILKIKDIVFYGSSVITIISEVIKVIMNDLCKPWAAKHLPRHKIWMLKFTIIFNKNNKKKRIYID